MDTLLICTLLLVLTAEVINGWIDAPMSIAAVVSSQVMTARAAVFLAVGFNIAGTLCGTAVAQTLGRDLLNPALVDERMITAACLAVIVWGWYAAHRGLPISTTRALFAGLVGAGLALGGRSAFIRHGWFKVFLGFLCSSFLSMLLAYVLAMLIKLRFAHSSPVRAKKIFDRLQIISTAGIVFNHGLNDGQKFVGLFTLTLVAGRALPAFIIPFWVSVLCALVMGVGTYVGARNASGALGVRLVKLESWQGFAAQAAAAWIMTAASHFGLPLSTNNTIARSLVGAGIARRLSAVRWHVTREMSMVWMLTIPISAALAFAIGFLLKYIL